MTPALEIFTVYKHPRDYPQGYVVRRSVIGGGREELCLAAERLAQYAPDLMGARAFIPLGKSRMPRERSDDPAILEVWL